MNSRQRWLAVLQRKPADRAPCDIWATDEVFGKLCEKFHCRTKWELFDKLDIDAPYTVGPVEPRTKAGFDIWGVGYKKVDYGTGVYNEAVSAPLAYAETLRDIRNFPWPDADRFDYSKIKGDIKKYSHRPIRAGYVEPFLIYSQIRGLERAMMDLIEHIDLVECAFDYIFDFAVKLFERILDESDGMVDITVPAEDLGSQTGSLFSIETFKKLHKPRFSRYIEIARRAKVSVFFHTDGACREFIPELIEIGVDILNPIQWKCSGMDRQGLKRDFGKDLIFHGGVDNQHVLPFGSPADVRQEVIACFDTLGLGGGYICAPCHNIQPNTPMENILEMYNTIKDIASKPQYIHSH